MGILRKENCLHAIYLYDMISYIHKMSSLPKIIAIVGPTASGKSDLAVHIALRLGSGQAKREFGINGAEIVSADSRQVYRGMDIGTSKTPRDKNPQSSILNPPFSSSGIPHHLLDIKNPGEEYAVAEYKNDAIAAIKEILKKNKLPILVGGTGLYLQAVLENLDIPKTKPDTELRKKIELEIKRKGLTAVFEKLVELDHEASFVVDRKNPRRVVRALEVAMTTGKSFVAARRKAPKLFDALEIGLNPPPDVLRERIGSRIDQMLNDGFVQEVKNLIEKYGEDCQAFDAIGYREITDYLKRKTPLEKSTADMKVNTWHYAKRQMTWFKRDKEIHWVKDGEEAGDRVKKFLGQSRE